MLANYFPREIEKSLKKALSQFPAVIVTGARQTGKSTLLQQSLKNYRYASFDDPTLRELAQKDPKLFLSTHPPPVIIDEIQYAPGLLPYLKLAIDQQRQAFGRFVLTGSQTFQLMHGISETLAGRIAVFHLYPFHTEELPNLAQTALKNDLKLGNQVVRGFYPELNTRPDLDRDLWFGSYITTYLERDVRNIKKIGDLSKFQSFISLLAARAGALLNMSEVAKECGITQPTAREWMTILQSTYVIHLLQPWHRNMTKRVVKTPKLYFVDTGLLCYLLGIDSTERFYKSAERGGIFENLVIMETQKRIAARARNANLFFFRTAAGVEVDLLIEEGGRFTACEIKLSKTPNSKMAENLKRAGLALGFTKGAVLTIQDSPLPLTEAITSTHWITGLEALLFDNSPNLP